MRLVSCAQWRPKTQHSSLNKQRISKTTLQKFIYANTLDVSKTCTSKTLTPGGHATLLLQDWKKRLKARDGSTRREKNTCRERFKGNVGLHTSTLQSHRQSDTNRSHKNTYTTHTEIISVITKYSAKSKSTRTRTSFCKEECVCERGVLPPKKKCGSGSARRCAVRTNLQNKTQWGIRKRKEWRKREGRRAQRRRKWHFWNFLFVGRPFLFFILDSQLFS